MAFMQPNVTAKGLHWRIDTAHGTFYVPNDVYAVWEWIKPGHVVGIDNAPELLVRDLQLYVEPHPTAWNSIEVVTGYCGRLSAPGYLDATDWSFASTLRGIREQLRED